LQKKLIQNFNKKTEYKYINIISLSDGRGLSDIKAVLMIPIKFLPLPLSFSTVLANVIPDVGKPLR
jgi:hypothetical protein